MTKLHDLDPRRSWPGFLIAAGLSLVLLFVLLRPGVSDGLTGVPLVLFWAAHVLVPLALLQGTQIVLSRLPRIAALNPWVQTALSGLGGSALFAPLALVLDAVFGLATSTDDLSMSWPLALIDEFLGLAPIVTFVWLALNATRLLRLDPVTRAETASEPAEPDLWQRVPRSIGRDLVALSAELHYLRVRTTAGEALVLYPFGKAVADLSRTGGGLQIHRSHWVALGHVQRIDRRGQGAICTLDSGLALPVSRQYRAALLAAFAAVQDAQASLRA
ncbi:MAG: LytTR family transcriptional regulator [Rhodobacterales bacterium]|nr:MAG: LytTR family transcriptional regulator [Rhodobacterales bacterium]